MNTPTSRYPIYQVDAFADAVFRGNPAAVVPLAEWLPDEIMQAIAMENQLSETAFYVPEESGFRLRWFTPLFEVDLCGHATLATAHVLFAEHGYEGKEVAFFTRSGELKVSRKGEGYAMDFPTDELRFIENDEVAAALGTAVRELYRGKDDFLAVLESEEIVKSLCPDFRRVAELEARGVIVTATADDTENLDFVSRCFFPKYGIDEDPVTGSAHTTMAPYWSGRLGKNDFRAAQLSARGGRVDCELSGDRITLSGEAVTFLRGEIELPRE